MAVPIKLDYETRVLTLPAGLADGEVAFVSATIFVDPPLPFAIVKYQVSGNLQEKGLRMDLDKRVFLDHFEDAKFEKALRAAGPRVAMAIGQARSESLPRQAARA